MAPVAGVLFSRICMAHLKLSKTTYSAKPADIERKWFVVDADGMVLGRLATGVAAVLKGKHKAIYTPSMDTGDCVVVINAEKVVLTGNKETDKMYYRYSGYPGGMKETPASKVRDDHPERLVLHAVKGMLPHNRLGRAMLKKLHVYAGPDHPHGAQKPEPLEIKG